MSRDRRREFVEYQINDSEAMARRLEKMAARGWLLEKADNWGWTYRRGEPGPVRYAVTYFPEASVFDPAPTEGQETYIDYCRAAGWELAAAYGPVQYFRSTRPDPTPIETDEGAKLETIRRSMRKSFVLSYALLLAVMGLNLWLRLDSFGRDPLAFISRTSNLSLTLLLAGMVIYCAAFLLDYLIWVLRSRRAVARGGRCGRVHTQARLWSGRALLAVCAVTLAGYLADFAGPGTRWILLYSFGGLGVVLAASYGTLRLLKSRGCRRRTNRAAFLAVVAVLSVLYGASIPLVVVRLSDTLGLRGDREPAYVYTNRTGAGGTYEVAVYLDELPVTLEELGFPPAEEGRYSFLAETSRSPLAVHSAYSQSPADWSGGLPSLEYETYAIRWGWLRRLCWETLTAPERGGSYRPAYSIPVEPPPAGAEEVRRTENGRRYAALREDGIVLLSGDWELTPGQAERILIRVGQSFQ